MTLPEAFIKGAPVGSFISLNNRQASGRTPHPRNPFDVCPRMRYPPDDLSADGQSDVTPADQAFKSASHMKWHSQQNDTESTSSRLHSNFYRINPDDIQTDNEENLRAFIKTRGSLIPGEEIVFWWTGSIHSMNDGEPSRHIFDFEGYNIGRMMRVDGGWRLLTREVGLYKLPNTDQIVNIWQNPFTGDSNKCVHVWNDPVNQQFLLHGPRGDFRVPTTMQGDDIYWHSEIFLNYKSPLSRKEYPNQAQSDTYQSTEMFQFFCKRQDMLSNKASADCLISWVRVGQWLPWMEMGDRPGRLIYHCRGRKLKNGFADLSDSVRTFVLEQHPEYSAAPTNYSTPNETSWTYMKKLLDSKGSPRADGTVARAEHIGNSVNEEIEQHIPTEMLSMTTVELSSFDGSDPTKPIYISLAGKIFDVSSAKRHYKKGETYNCLTGRDATYAFVSGDLTGEALDNSSKTDLQHLTKDQEHDLNKWVSYFTETYPEVGSLSDH